MVFSDDLFDGDLSSQEKLGVLEGVVGEWKAKGVGMVCDIVWNHTSCDSEWLREYPDSGTLFSFWCFFLSYLLCRISSPEYTPFETCVRGG